MDYVVNLPYILALDIFHYYREKRQKEKQKQPNKIKTIEILKQIQVSGVCRLSSSSS